MIIKKNKKILLLSFVIFCATFMLGAFLKANAALVSGYLWGAGAEIDGVSPWDGTNTNVGWIDMSRVDIPFSDGNVSGYGWSENIGWVDFDAVGPYPSIPNNSVQRVGNNLVGWARIVGIATESAVGNSGGWQGWIKMNNVSINSATGQMSGYAWSDELGWIDFSGVNIGIDKILNVNLSAIPNSCVGCASLDFTLTATRENTSTTLGDIVYEFDCNGDGIYENSYTTTNNTQSQNCSTSVSVTAGVRMSQDGKVAAETANVSIIPAVCGNGVVENGEQCDDGADNGSCPISSCSASCANVSCPGDFNWIEVAP